MEKQQDRVLGSVRLRPARQDLKTTEPALETEDASFDQVAHHTDDVTDMVPV
jgi:hypothetical protein